MTSGDESNRSGQSDQQPAASSRDASTEGCRVLIVEDEPMIARLQKSFLAKLGLAGYSVGSGEDAISFLQEHGAHLVISDVRLPGRIDGVKLYQWVRENQPELKTKFLFISGDIANQDLENLLRQDSVASLQKPFSFEEYRKAVSELLSSRR